MTPYLLFQVPKSDHSSSNHLLVRPIRFQKVHPPLTAHWRSRNCQTTTDEKTPKRRIVFTFYPSVEVTVHLFVRGLSMKVLFARCGICFSRRNRSNLFWFFVRFWNVLPVDCLNIRIFFVVNQLIRLSIRYRLR